MEISENSRVNFNGVEALKWLVSLVVIAWTFFSFISAQKETDLKQQNEIEQIRIFQKQTDTKLDKIIANQEISLPLLLKHEYELSNKKEKEKEVKN